MTLHTQQSITCVSPSQVGEHVDRSRFVSAQSHSWFGWQAANLTLTRVVNTPLCVTGPRVPLRSNLDDPEEWKLSSSDGESACWDEEHRTEPVACRPIIRCGMMGCAGSCPFVAVEYGYIPGNEPATCETWRKIFPRPKGTLSDPSPAESEGITGNRSRNSSPAISRKSSVVSWSEPPCEQLETTSTPSEQSAPLCDAEKAVVLDDASGPWEPGELEVISTCPLKNVTNTPEGESVCCGTTGRTESDLTSVAGHGFDAGLEPNTCEICGKTKRISRNVLLRGQSEPCLFSSGYGKASEHAAISSFPVPAVGGTSESAQISSSALRNASNTPEPSG